jgi:hypothetical protein
MNIQSRLKKIEKHLTPPDRAERAVDFSRLSDEQFFRLHDLRVKANESKNDKFNPKLLSVGELKEIESLAAMVNHL